MWVLVGVSLLAGVLAGVLIGIRMAEDRFVRFIPFVMCGAVALSLGIRILVSRFGRTDVTILERFARRLLFKQSPPN